MSLVAGMAAGADSIEDVDRLRQTGNQLVFAEMRAPSTLGTFLRAFTHGHVQQLNRCCARAWSPLAQRVDLLPGADQVVFVDLDSTHRQVYGYAKQGAAVGRHEGQEDAAPAVRHRVHADRPAGGGRDPAAAGQVRRRARGGPVPGRGPGRGPPDRPDRDGRGPRRQQVLQRRRGRHRRPVRRVRVADHRLQPERERRDRLHP